MFLLRRCCPPDPSTLSDSSSWLKKGGKKKSASVDSFVSDVKLIAGTTRPLHKISDVSETLNFSHSSRFARNYSSLSATSASGMAYPTSNSVTSTPKAKRDRRRGSGDPSIDPRRRLVYRKSEDVLSMPSHTRSSISESSTGPTAELELAVLGSPKVRYVHISMHLLCASRLSFCLSPL